MKFLLLILLFLSIGPQLLLAQTGPYYCGRSCDCINYYGETASGATSVSFRASDSAWGNQEHSNQCHAKCKAMSEYAGGSTTGVGPCSWSAGKVCSVAHRSTRGTWSFWYWSADNDARYTDLCGKAVKDLKEKSGLQATQWKQTWFLPNTVMTAVAHCQNGTWKASGKGIEAFQNVNAKRKEAGGTGCYFDRG